MTAPMDGSDIAMTWYAPETLIFKYSKTLQNFSEKSPILSKFVFVPLSAISGFIKTLLFPVISAVGTVILPIIAAIGACMEKKNAGAYFKAGGICLLGVFGFATFAVFSAYYLPLPVSSTIFMVAIATSIAVHVHRASKDYLIIKPAADRLISLEV